ncbi:MAG: tetratricopeptide repeat protein [Myxococcota bacterium]
MPQAGSMTGAEREAFVRGRQCLERGDSVQALGYLTRVLDSCPRFADVHYLLGLAHEELGNAEAATQSFEAALRINPGYAEAFLALASAYERAGDFEGSRELAARTGPAVLRASGVPPVEPGAPDPTTRAKLANLQAALGDAYQEVGDLQDAVEAYRKALRRCPTFHDIRQRLGIALREAGLGSQAVREFRRILQANPTYLDAAVQLGLTLYTMGRTREAVAEWQRVLDRDPSRESARMYLKLVARRPRTG